MKCGPRPRSGPCAPARGTSKTLRDIVGAYIRNKRDMAAKELRYFAVQRSLTDAVRRAASCELPGGKRHPHQRRIPARSLAEARRRLLVADLRSASDFDDLHEMVGELIGGIRRVGELTVYDIALRVGAKLGLAPERVYLHRGTRHGARELGLGRGRKTLEMFELPREFHRLTAAEAEDCLCLHSDDSCSGAKILSAWRGSQTCRGGSWIMNRRGASASGRASRSEARPFGCGASAAMCLSTDRFIESPLRGSPCSRCRTRTAWSRESPSTIP